MPKGVKGEQCQSSFNDLGRYAPSSLRYWTKTAVECYKSHFNCLDCPTYYLMESQPCQMKAAVLELFKKHGEPTEETVRRSYDIG